MTVREQYVSVRGRPQEAVQKGVGCCKHWLDSSISACVAKRPFSHCPARRRAVFTPEWMRIISSNWAEPQLLWSEGEKRMHTVGYHRPAACHVLQHRPVACHVLQHRPAACHVPQNRSRSRSDTTAPLRVTCHSTAPLRVTCHRTVPLRVACHRIVAAHGQTPPPDHCVSTALLRVTGRSDTRSAICTTQPLRDTCHTNAQLSYIM